MNKVYNISGAVKEWLKDHFEDLYEDVLNAAEIAAVSVDTDITVCSLRTITGVTNYILSTSDDVVKSLKKAEAHFVEVEDYEKAARARDCGMIWQEKSMIYKQNN
jgi:hypothetical protein